jgi:hypothetical protein
MTNLMPEHSTLATYDGPLVNGCPALTEQRIQEWCRQAHMCVLSGGAAAEMARTLNHYAWLSPLWIPKFSERQKANPSMQRIRRIAGALETLQNDLPGLLADSRVGGGDVSLTEALYDLALKHDSIVAEYRRAPGRPSDKRAIVASKVGELLIKVCEARLVTEKARDAFVTKAMEWLCCPVTESAISRGRRRRANRT